MLVSSSFKNFISSTDLLAIRSHSPEETTVEIIVLKKVGWINTPESLIIKIATYIWWAGLCGACFLWRKNLHKNLQPCHPTTHWHFSYICPVPLKQSGNLHLKNDSFHGRWTSSLIAAKLQGFNGVINELIIWRTFTGYFLLNNIHVKLQTPPRKWEAMMLKRRKSYLPQMQVSHNFKIDSHEKGTERLLKSLT